MTCPVCARDDADTVHSLSACGACADVRCEACDCHDEFSDVPEIVKEATRWFINEYRDALRELG